MIPPGIYLLMYLATFCMLFYTLVRMRFMYLEWRNERDEEKERLENND